MALTAGSLTNLENSMAGAIKDAFVEEWPSIMKSDPPPVSDQMKLLFIAIAKGVVNHLIKNPDSFVISIHTSADTNIACTGKVDEIISTDV